MFRHALAVACVVALLTPASGVAGVAASSAAPNPDHSPAADPRIAAVYPNPVPDGDRGEYVAVEFPTETDLSGWSIADDDATVRLPNRTVSGRVAFSAAPATARNVTDTPVLPLPDGLTLANGGETVELRRGNTTVDSAAYRDAPEGERRIDGEWVPFGATDHAPVGVGGTAVEAFALPDSPRVPRRALTNADDRILLAGYTLTSDRVVRTLRRAADRGVEVRVLVDGAPVGGTSARQVRALDRLAESDVTVRAVGGDYARYRFYHAKYAVVDDRALVLTENWKPAGTGGGSSRGWGAVVRDGEFAAELATVFRSDWRARDARPWTDYRDTVDPVAGEADRSSYPERFAPRNLTVDRVRLLTAPDNAESGITGEIAAAEESVLVQQASLGGLDTPPVRATVAAARRGVRVRILLSSAWYAREENRATVRRLNDLADREGLDLAARIAEPRSRYGKIHAKGVVIDQRRVVLGSINWNNNSLRANREVAVVLVGDEVGGYYARLFRADWRGGAWRLPVGVAGGVAAATLGASLYARRKVEFG
ncbi:phospholipase D-like domain-containing protein [Halostella salina]|uniref:phospholipase D-like domain-containing protein n=1 Tax=Halostella salina TaxID=1547897 RepID=UPI001F09E24B|nr:phospholipase D-like domain-containing protein [Halostella salina]